jgi:hypothetical protein
MSTNRRICVIASLAVLVTLGGCGGNEVVRPTVNVSIGQQLIDLKTALNSGAISQSEYESQRSKLIKSVE